MSLPRTFNGHELTIHQLEVLAACGREGRIRAAARRLHLSEQTVRNELHAIYSTLAVPGIAAALWLVFVPDTEA